MLSKTKRIDRKTVEKIFTNGVFVGSAYLSLKFFIDLDKNTPAQVAFIAPKSVAKKAVVRNLLRRRGYAVVEKHVDSLPGGFVGAFVFGKKSLEVFGGKRSKVDNPNQNLEKEVINLLKKLNEKISNKTH